VTRMRKVVITGIGLCSGLGIGVDVFWKRLVGAESALRAMNLSRPVGRGLGAPLPSNEELPAMPKLLWSIDLALHEALIDAHLQPGDRLASAAAVVGGSNFSDNLCWAKGGDFFEPLRRILEEHDLNGPFWGLSTACASGVGAIGLACDLIKFEEEPLVLVCGYDIIDEHNYRGLASLRALSPDLIRPFDKERDGTLLGEGVGLLVLEEMGHASARGANIYAEVLGYGISNDGYHFTAPDPSGIGMRVAMQQALAEARVCPADIDHLNAHGTGTLHNDRIEAKAIHAVFGEHARFVPITSNKSAIGHCMGASGTLETIAAILSLRDQIVPPILNVETPDLDCGLDCVFNVPRLAVMEKVMCNSYGLWGCNASMVLARPKRTGS